MRVTQALRGLRLACEMWSWQVQMDLDMNLGYAFTECVQSGHVA